MSLLTIKKPNNKLNTNSKFFNENSKKFKSIHEQRELQLSSSMSKSEFDYEKTQSYAKLLLCFYENLGWD